MVVAIVRNRAWWVGTLLLLLLSSCTNFKDDERALLEQSAPRQLYASSGSIASRTTAKDDKYIEWSAGDEIAYFANQNSKFKYRFQSLSSENDCAIFSRVTDTMNEGNALNCNYAIYPYVESVVALAEGKIMTELPAVQHYAKDSFGIGAATMVAVSEGKSGEILRFKSAVGFLKLQLYGKDVVVKRISLCGNNSERIAGVAVLSASYGATPSVIMDKSATKEVVLECGEGVRLSDNSFEPTSFWFALPETSFTNGFTITIYDKEGTPYLKQTTKPYSIDCNMIQPMKAFDVRSANIDIEDENGTVLFYLEERDGGICSLPGLGSRDWSAARVLVNGVEYAVSIDNHGNPFVRVATNDKGVYNAALLAEHSEEWYSDTPYGEVILPPSQFEMRSVAMVNSFPMYGSYSKANGRTLLFDYGFSLLRLRLRGDADIVSVRVEAKDRYDLAGRVSVDSASGEYSVVRGTNFVALNCTNEGKFVSLSKANYRDFYLMIAPGDYTDGLRLSVCDTTHGAAFYDLSDVKVGAGEVYTFEAEYTPNKDQIFYEGFDNCVWGGDVVRGSEGVGFAPDDSVVKYNTNLDRIGYEEALTEVPYDVPGTGFVQSNTWSEVSGFDVNRSHQTTDSYITSRHFADTRYLFRTQEHPGYMAIGTARTTRGIYRTPMLKKVSGMGALKARIRFAMQAGFNGTLQAQIIKGGRIVGATLNGKPLTLTTENPLYSGVTSTLEIDNSMLSVPSSASEKKEWQTLELDIADASNGSFIHITDKVVSTGVHGIYLDSIEAWQTSEWERKPSTLRVLLWNLQNGMWADQHNNYDNFVEWVKKWNPDVCIWCESETRFKDKTNESSTTNYLPNGWDELCKRYGHSYAAVGGNRDDFPQSITSKYPITVEQRITNTDVSGKPVSHGAGHFTITVDGKKINIVTLHMWPQAYAPGVPAAEQEASAAKFEGDYHREHEMQYIVDHTVKSAKYANEELWLLGGDTNARSRLDNWYYNYDAASTKLMTHDILLNQTALKDVIGHRYPGCFISTTMGSARIDIMYASPTMYGKLDNAAVIIDEWLTDTAKSVYNSSFYDPSDHRPLLMDFDMSK